LLPPRLTQKTKENKLVLQNLLGTTRITALEEGLSNHFTQNWQKKGYRHWCGKLFRSQNLPALQELIDNESYKKESYLVMGAMSGVFVDFLLAKFSQLAKESLEKLTSLGNDAIAVVPYSFMRDPRTPSRLLIEHRDGGENDESVLFSHFEAQRLGMHTMLKPQIWIRGSWPGDIDMDSEQDWNRFFNNYY